MLIFLISPLFLSKEMTKKDMFEWVLHCDWQVTIEWAHSILLSLS